ncbi:hypothetical protein DMB66_60575, partial [Actinoplanes sp. ATCC 53533]|uniref:hypothetical protein n=1 Tax=Actinoplanes sp. ATCC 53533 TaxID=1288362 RepID=UPI001001DFAB
MSIDDLIDRSWFHSAGEAGFSVGGLATGVACGRDATDSVAAAASLDAVIFRRGSEAMSVPAARRMLRTPTPVLSMIAPTARGSVPAPSVPL